MPTKILYQGLGAGEKLVAYCREYPSHVLKKVFRHFRVYEYIGLERLLVENWPGLVIRGTSTPPPGTSITGSVEELDILHLIPDKAVSPVYVGASLSDEDVRKAVVRYMKREFSYNPHWMDRDAHMNYIVVFDDEKEKQKRPDWFMECNGKANILCTATAVMLDISTKEGLRDLFKQSYWPV